MAHSQRILVYPNSDLFEGNHVPWINDSLLGKEALQVFYSNGILSSGSAIMRDTIHIEYNKFGICVDTSEWLGLTAIWRKIQFRINITKENEAEDGAFQTDLLAGKAKVGCSPTPSLIYRLGGHSNSCKITSNERFNPINKHANFGEKTLQLMRLRQNLIIDGMCVCNHDDLGEPSTFCDKLFKTLETQPEDIYHEVTSFNESQANTSIGSLINHIKLLVESVVGRKATFQGVHMLQLDISNDVTSINSNKHDIVAWSTMGNEFEYDTSSHISTLESTKVKVIPNLKDTVLHFPKLRYQFSGTNITKNRVAIKSLWALE